MGLIGGRRGFLRSVAGMPLNLLQGAGRVLVGPAPGAGTAGGGSTLGRGGSDSLADQWVQFLLSQTELEQQQQQQMQQLQQLRQPSSGGTASGLPASSMPASAGTAGFGASGRGAAGLGNAGLGASAFGAAGLGASGFGAAGFGAAGQEAAGARFGSGAGAAGASHSTHTQQPAFGLKGSDAQASHAASHRVPPVTEGSSMGGPGYEAGMFGRSSLGAGAEFSGIAGGNNISTGGTGTGTGGGGIGTSGGAYSGGGGAYLGGGGAYLPGGSLGCQAFNAGPHAASSAWSQGAAAAPAAVTGSEASGGGYGAGAGSGAGSGSGFGAGPATSQPWGSSSVSGGSHATPASVPYDLKPSSGLSAAFGAQPNAGPGGWQEPGQGWGARPGLGPSSAAGFEGATGLGLGRGGDLLAGREAGVAGEGQSREGGMAPLPDWRAAPHENGAHGQVQRPPMLSAPNTPWMK